MCMSSHSVKVMGRACDFGIVLCLRMIIPQHPFSLIQVSLGHKLFLLHALYGLELHLKSGSLTNKDFHYRSSQEWVTSQLLLFAVETANTPSKCIFHY